MTLSFFGHADFIPRADHKEKLLSYLETAVGSAYAEFLFGGYGGFDAFAFTCALHYRRIHPNVKLTFVTPYINTAPPSNQFDGSVYPPIEHVPPRFAILHRNRWMIRQADIVVFYVKRAQGGAHQAYLYSEQLGKTSVNLAKGE